MKHIAATAAACLLALVSQASAEAPAALEAKAPKPVPTFGGFAKGLTFTFQVKEKLSSSTQGTTVNPTAPIPSSVPNFALGQNVTFTIGAKGELKTTKTNIPYLADGITANQYTVKPTRTNLNPSTAIVWKSGTTPTAVNLNFITVKMGRPFPTVTTVTYILQ
ncbi:MAG: hypothetical protein QM755_23250 [Luteolibacter sp.]